MFSTKYPGELLSLKINFPPKKRLNFIIFKFIIILIYNSLLISAYSKVTKYIYNVTMGFPDGSVDKEASCNARDTGDVSLIPESGRSPEGEKGNPLQYSCLENSMNRGTWQVTVGP